MIRVCCILVVFFSISSPCFCSFFSSNNHASAEKWYLQDLSLPLYLGDLPLRDLLLGGRVGSKGKLWVPLGECPVAVCSLNLPLHVLYNPYIVGIHGGTYIFRYSPQGYPDTHLFHLIVGSCEYKKKQRCLLPSLADTRYPKIQKPRGGVRHWTLVRYYVEVLVILIYWNTNTIIFTFLINQHPSKTGYKYLCDNTMSQRHDL